MPDFLLEIGCEEIPARMIDDARKVLQINIWELLGSQDILARDQQGQALQPESLPAFSTPRRLAILVEGLPERQNNKIERLIGPPSKAAFKNGQPTQAAEAFARKVGREVWELQTVSTEKGEYLSAVREVPGKLVIEILAEKLQKLISETYWPKTMYWTSKGRDRFVRPVRWIVALFGSEVIPLKFAGIEAGCASRGHRILTSEQRLEIRWPNEYEQILRRAFVIASGPERRERIWRQLVDASGKFLRIRESDAYFHSLLDTVTNLTEWPSVILGNFDEEFLSLPEEVLITVMRDHQKYFALEDLSGKLAPHFLAVLNTANDANGMIRHGNERVLRARFGDAQFFWNADNSRPFSERREMLKAIKFQEDLGSYYEKTERIMVQVERLSASIVAELQIDRWAAIEAALLSKNDLTTELVKEFTELQGVIGGLYASYQGESQKVAVAIYDQYKPTSTEDSVPRTLEGAVLSIADKADTIAGMFALGEMPSGSSDPFALRRQANGIVKTMAEKDLGIRFSDLFTTALRAYQGTFESNFKVSVRYDSLEDELRFAFGPQAYFAPLKKGTDYPHQRIAIDIATFFRDRVQFYLREIRQFRYDIVNAVVAAGYDDVPDLLLRAEATTQIAHSDYLEPISIAFKRMKNILRQAKERGYSIEIEGLADDLESKQAEKLLLAANLIGSDFRRYREGKRYANALALMSTLRSPIDEFFDSVMVMVGDERIRANRLGLIQQLVGSFSLIADFSEIVTEKN